MLLNASITHIQLHIDGFSETVGLFGCSCMETYLRGEEFQFESRVTVTTVQRNSSNLHIRKFKEHSCINKCVSISVLPLSTLSGRIRIGVGHISNTIEHTFLATVPV